MIKYTKKQIAELDKYYVHPRNLVDLFQESAARWGGRYAFGTKNPATKVYTWVTYGEVAERVNNLRGALKKIGLKKKEAVGCIIGNSVEWFVIENATHGLGGRYVPMYEKELPKTWEYIIRESGLRFLFVKNREIYDKVKHFKRTIPTLHDIFVIHGEGKDSMASLEERGKKFPVKPYSPHWSEIAEIIYTSGTTGNPKGVLLSHGNLSACSQAGYHIYPDLNQDSVSLSILPWAHVYGLSAELHNFLQFGGSMGIMESVDTLAQDLLAVKPTYLIAVPRVFNKVYEGIQAKMKVEGGVKKMLFDKACAEAVKCRGREKKTLKFKLLDKIVFSNIRGRFGGRLQGVMTASAVMNPEIALFFRDIGLPTFDCYGLTETAPAITMNSPLKGNKYGSVGKCVENMHVKIDKSRVGDGSDDGEIIAYGAHVMSGYHNKPKETAAIMVKDRWNGFPGIRTGDRGRLDSEGFLHITGRFKDEYKLSNGKYVHPESIETDIKLLGHVSNAMVCGEGKLYNVCLAVPNFESLKKDPATAKWAKGSPEEAVKDRELREYLDREISEHLRKTYGGYEVPRKYMFTAEEFTHDNGMLTQTMKIVRRNVLHKYGKDLERLYED